MDVAVIGIDLGKNSCSVAGMDAAGGVVFRRRASRAGLMEIVRRRLDLAVGDLAPVRASPSRPAAQ